jgi:D-3-phosphoglycerate dehydrogenase / 2-oxoglutarate reductase
MDSGSLPAPQPSGQPSNPLGVVLVCDPFFPMDDVRELVPSAEPVEAWGSKTEPAVDLGAVPPGARVRGLLISSSVALPGSIIRALPDLEAVVSGATGFDNIDLQAARGTGVCVCHVPGYCTQEVADHAIALALCLVRGVTTLDRSVRAGHWSHTAAGPLRRLDRLRFGVLGTGRIGRAVIRRARGVGCEVLAADPLLGPEAAQQAGARPVSVEELLRSADVLSLHIALTSDTRGFIGTAELDMLPPASMLVNTARAELVDLPAVVERLRSGRLGGAAFDVFDREPPPPDHPLLSAPNVVLTPHASWYSTESGPELVRRVCLAMQTILAGGRPAEGVLVEGSD